MKSIYENVLENETTISIIKFELNLSKDIIRNIIKRMNLIASRKDFVNHRITNIYNKEPLYSECERYSHLSRKERLNEGRIRNFGTWENYINSMENQYKESMLNIYGVEHSSQSEKIKEKIAQTNLKKYGVENVFQSEQIKEIIRQTNLEKYGTENPMQNEQIKNKSMETQKELYGKIAFIDSYKCKKYKCGDVYFDSQWEIYMYYYLVKNNIKFEYQYKFKYKDLNGKEHIYKCDFHLIDSDDFIEIKNPSFLTEDGKLRTIYKKGLTEKQLEERNMMEDCKMKCMEENNVKIITDISFYKNWFDENCKDLIIEQNH